jgi:hypothetical protein
LKIFATQHGYSDAKLLLCLLPLLLLLLLLCCCPLCCACLAFQTATFAFTGAAKRVSDSQGSLACETHAGFSSDAVRMCSSCMKATLHMRPPWYPDPLQCYLDVGMAQI